MAMAPAPSVLFRRALRRTLLRRPPKRTAPIPYLLLTLIALMLSGFLTHTPPTNDMSVVIRTLANDHPTLPLPAYRSPPTLSRPVPPHPDPLTSRVDAIVGDEAGAKSGLTDLYMVPAHIVANMSQSVASRLYWKLVYTDVVSALRSHHDSDAVNTHRPRFEAKARVFFVHTQNGLGNRLRALASGLAIARATGRVPVVVWECDAHLGAPFNQLFETTSYGSDIHTVLYKDLIVMQSFPSWPDVAASAPEWYPMNYMTKDGALAANGAEMNFVLPSNPQPLRPANLMDSMGAIDGINEADRASLRLTKRKLEPKLPFARNSMIEENMHVYFKSAYVARAVPEHLSDSVNVNRELMSLRPVKVVTDIVNSVHASLLAKSIGIHIRSRSLANDNVKVDWNCEYTASGAEITDYWRKQSGLNVFVKQMSKVIWKRPDASFFVAADDVKVLNQLQQKFPGRVHSIARNCDDRDHSCVVFALADLLCLSKTQEIYGSNWSSFTEAAGRLGNKRVRLSGVDFAKKKPLPRWRRTIARRFETLVRVWYGADRNPYYKCTKHR